MSLILRAPQQQALDYTHAHYHAGKRRLLIQMATGVGKTPMFVSLRRFFGFTRKILVLVHMEDLADQARRTIEEWEPEEPVSVEMGNRYHTQTDTFIVASVPTLAKTQARLASFHPEEFDAVICDEAHHSIAPSWRKVLAHFGFTDGSHTSTFGTLLLGVTATPERGDRQGLIHLYEAITFRYPMLQAIRDGYLVMPRCYRIHTGVSLDKLSRTAIMSQASSDAIATVIDTMIRNRLIVDAYLRYGNNQKGITFCANIEHAVHVAQAFNASGVPAVATWGIDDDRDAKMQAHRSGDVQMLCNVRIAIEGYDDKSIGCVILGRPSGSSLLIEQMIGRGLRLEHGVRNMFEALAAGQQLLKRDCIILDIADNTKKHKMANFATLMGLPANLNTKGKPTLEIVETFEKYEKDFPDIDYDQLEDINNIRAYAEDVDLFSSHLKADPSISSRYLWARLVVAGALVYQHSIVKGKGSLRVTMEGGQWIAEGTVAGSSFRQGGFSSSTEAIRFADQAFETFGRGLITDAKRDSEYNNRPANSFQKNMLRQMMKKHELESLDPNLTLGEAHVLIQKLMARQFEQNRKWKANRT